MPTVTYQLYGPLGNGETVEYFFKKGKAGAYDLHLSDAGYVGSVYKCGDGWSDSFTSIGKFNTRREASEAMIDAQSPCFQV